MKTYTKEEYRALEQENNALRKQIEKLELNERINLKMIGEDTRFRFKIVKILLAMSRRLNLLPDARQTGFSMKTQASKTYPILRKNAWKD